MTISRSPGRYNLHRLGWSAFEDLCVQILRVVLGETCSRFRPGRDAGRDGWFVGTATGLFASQNQLHGAFLVQCKHTSSVKVPLDEGHVEIEMANVRAFAARTPCNYVLMTNRQVSAIAESSLRQAFEAIPGVSRCLVLSETWIEDTIDAHPRLLRLVPRLYGIGDLSQIISFVISQQTSALLEDLAGSLRTFVPTDSYRRAEAALAQHGFVVLVGPPASGKSAIAANLCTVTLAQDSNARLLRIEHADQFKSTWSPADEHLIYWVDDVFGETTLDEDRLREWSAALEKVEAARKRQARIIFCTRDYILAAAQRKLKQSKADTINDARVRVDVTALSAVERESILYNHVKHGDITREQKRSLKSHLPWVARLASFSPELARRLGNHRFNTLVVYRSPWLKNFFEDPVQHFRDVIHGLSASETAVLAVCLLSGNAVPDPIPDDALADAVLRTYSVPMQHVREAFEQLEDSLVKRVRQGTAQTWQVHHPSMIEALQEELASKSSQFVLYLQSAKLSAILRDTTTLTPPQDSRLVFVPDSVYGHLILRLSRAGVHDYERVADYLSERSSDELLNRIHTSAPELIDTLLAITPEPDISNVAPRFAMRLDRVSETTLIDERRWAILLDTLRQAVRESGWSDFFDIDGILNRLSQWVKEYLVSELENGFGSFDTLKGWYAQDLSSKDHVLSAVDALDAHARRLSTGLEWAGLASEEARDAIVQAKAEVGQSLEERLNEFKEIDERRAESEYDSWKESRYEDEYEREHGRFADVDE